jgi:SAM-dependent methyltransferase
MAGLTDRPDAPPSADSVPILHRDSYGNVEIWICRTDAERIFSGAFWNDEEAERGKEWWIADGDDRNLLEHLDELNAHEAFAITTDALRNSGRLGGRVLDAGAGTCWSAALWSRLPEINRIDAVEFSWHRISTLAGPTIDALHGLPEKICRIFGSFTDIRRRDGTYDIISMAAAFHHCSEPATLIAELDRCLAPAGAIVLIGEEPVGAASIVRRFAANLIKRGKLCLSFAALFPPHPKIGDHYYRRQDYKRLFAAAGFAVRFLPVGRSNVAIIATRNGEQA